MKEKIDLNGLTIAHRGIFDNKLIPENSYLSFKKALDYNLPIELDVRMTKDKVLVVFHDANLKRMTNIDKLIKETEYEELKKYNLLNTNEKIPTLEEILKFIDGKVLLDIEIKIDDNIKEFGKIFNQVIKKYKGQFIVKSFNPKMVRWLKNNNKQICRGLLIAEKYNNKIYDYLLTSKFILAYTKPDFLAVSKNILNTKKIRKIKMNYPILVWTILNKKELEKYKENSNSYICNNLPY